MCYKKAVKFICVDPVISNRISVATVKPLKKGTGFLGKNLAGLLVKKKEKNESELKNEFQCN